MNILLFDTTQRQKFFPLTLTRALADIRMGILTVKERWEKLLNRKAYVLTDPYLQPLYGNISAGEYIVIDSSVIATAQLAQAIRSLSLNEGLYFGTDLVAGKILFESTPSFSNSFNNLFHVKREISDARRLQQPCNIFQWNDEVLRSDFVLVSKGRRSNNNDLETSHIIKASQVFIEEGAKVDYSILNASTGPIYIGKNATIMEGCAIRGPFALCEGATLKMGAKIYGSTTLGPGCVGGGEIKNAVMFGYSNKAHDGYLGDSVVGEWCNMGAGTSNSNVKNTASDVKVWNYQEHAYISAGTKCGLVMGDYSRTSINTSINTGTVVGVCCNILSDGLTPKVISNFTWNTKELTRYEFDKALRDIDNWKKMKGKEFLSSEKDVLRFIFDNYND